MELIDFPTIQPAQEPVAKRPTWLPPDTFFLGVELIWSHLRLKESDRWQSTIALLKHRSFVSEFPEVTAKQFLWTCERWVQASGGEGFQRFPTWRELMAPLYRCENGLANRTWGMRPDLPANLLPTQEQLALMPSTPETLYPTRDPCHALYSPPPARPQLAPSDGRP